MNFDQLVTNARTCRKFQAEPALSIGDLEYLIDCARKAPSARNAQQLRFILATQKEIIARITANVRWAKVNGETWAPDTAEYPAGIIAVLMPAKDTELIHYDVGIACQTMQLAAAAKGWGACIIWAFNREILPKILEVPAGYQIAVLMDLGVPGQKRALENAACGASTTCVDKDGIHYVPKNRSQN